MRTCFFEFDFWRTKLYSTTQRNVTSVKLTKSYPVTLLNHCEQISMGIRSQPNQYLREEL